MFLLHSIAIAFGVILKEVSSFYRILVTMAKMVFFYNFRLYWSLNLLKVNYIMQPFTNEGSAL